MIISAHVQGTRVVTESCSLVTTLWLSPMICCWVVAQGEGVAFLVAVGVQEFVLTDCLDAQELWFYLDKFSDTD